MSRALEEVEGVESVQVELAKQQATVLHKELPERALREAVAAAGYTVVEVS